MEQAPANLQAAPGASRWSQRATMAAIVVVGLFVLHALIEPALLPGDVDRPLTVLVGAGGVLAALAVLAASVLIALLGEASCGRRRPATGLMLTGLTLALWAALGGNMDQWLIRANPRPGPGTAAAYYPLLAEYVYWTLALAGCLAACLWWQRRLASQAPPPTEDAERPVALRDGLAALLLQVAVAATLMFILTGPRFGHTYRGQVYFAVAVAFIVGTVAGHRFLGVDRLTWYLPGPILVGLAGVGLAIARPALPGVYASINVIPAWGLVRPLPIEMVAVGSAAIVLTLRPASLLSWK